MSISPKLENTDNQLLCDTLARFVNAYDYQLIFVIGKESDIDQVHAMLEGLPSVDRDKVMLMPLAATRNRYLETAPMVAELCIRSGFAFSPRLQVVLWDNAKGR